MCHDYVGQVEGLQYQGPMVNVDINVRTRGSSKNLYVCKNYLCYSFLLLLILADVVSEDAILKWYKETHSSRGWQVFMEQMKKFVEWLENADEGEHF